MKSLNILTTKPNRMSKRLTKSAAGRIFRLLVFAVTLPVSMTFVLFTAMVMPLIALVWYIIKGDTVDYFEFIIKPAQIGVNLPYMILGEK